MGDALRELVQKMKAAAGTVHPVLDHAAEILGTYQVVQLCVLYAFKKMKVRVVDNLIAIVGFME